MVNNPYPCITGDVQFLYLLEWSRSFTIVDSSIFDSAIGGIRVNCFQKKYAAWLPQIEKGDVVILHGLKVG